MRSGSDLWRYLRAHRPWGVIASLAGLLFLLLTMGEKAITLPAADGDGHAEMHYYNLAPLGIAAVAVGSLASTMADVEDAAASRHRRTENIHLFALCVISLISVGVIQAAVLSVDSATVHMRSLLVWIGLALLSGRIFGRPQAWILPLSTLFPLQFLGTDQSNEVRWWNWTLLPTGSLPAWGMAAAAVTAGIAAVALTPWRLHEVKLRLQRRGT